jgi:hypothetical protein
MVPWAAGRPPRRTDSARSKRFANPGFPQHFMLQAAKMLGPV